MTEKAEQAAGAAAKAPEQPAPAAAKVPAAQKKEKPDKCEQCSKPLSRMKWYYRDGGYYCTRRCWKEFRAKRQAEAAKAEPKPAAQS